MSGGRYHDGSRETHRISRVGLQVSGLYRGMTSPIAGVAAVNAVVFGVYGHARRHLSEPDRPSACFLAGASAGLAQTPISSPIELAKTRLQLQSSSIAAAAAAASGGDGGDNPRGPMRCLRAIYKREGCRGVFRGLGVTFLREGPSYGVYFATYEMLTRTRSNQPITTPHMLLAGGLAGTASWVISYPVDVIKSRIQAANGDRYAGALDCLRKSVRAEGYGCLYRGLNSTVLRAFPTNAATFAVVTWTFRLFGEQPIEDRPRKRDGVGRPTSTPKGRAAKGRESFAGKWHALFDGVSRGNGGFATVSYTAVPVLSIGGLMPASNACLAHNCRRSGCKHDALEQRDAYREACEKRRREPSTARSDGEEAEEGERVADGPRTAENRRDDGAIAGESATACTCDPRRALHAVSKLGDT